MRYTLGSPSADAAFLWLSTGGSPDEVAGVPPCFPSLSDIKFFTQRFSEDEVGWSVRSNNIFEFNLVYHKKGHIARYIEAERSLIAVMER